MFFELSRQTQKTFGKPIVNYFSDLNVSLVVPDAYHSSILINDEMHAANLFGVIEYEGKVVSLKATHVIKNIIGYKNRQTDKEISVLEWNEKFQKYFDMLDEDEDEDSDNQDIPISVSQKIKVIRDLWEPIYEFHEQINELSFDFYEGKYETGNSYIKNNFYTSGMAMMGVYQRQTAILDELNRLVKEHDIPFTNSSHSFLRFGKMFGRYVFNDKWSDSRISDQMFGKIKELENQYKEDMQAINLLVKREIGIQKNAVSVKDFLNDLEEIERMIHDVKPTKATQEKHSKLLQKLFKLKENIDEALIKH